MKYLPKTIAVLLLAGLVYLVILQIGKTAKEPEVQKTTPKFEVITAKTTPLDLSLFDTKGK